MKDNLWLFWTGVIVAGVVANYVWRFAGAYLAHGLHPQSPMMLWVRDVSTALIAALIARLLFEPAGALAGIPFAVRALAFVTGVIAFFASGKSLLLALALSEGVFFLTNWLL